MKSLETPFIGGLYLSGATKLADIDLCQLHIN
jgi:hypothetical protein